MPPLTPADFLYWAKTTNHVDDVLKAEWEDNDISLTILFANDAIQSLQALIADICIHTDKQANRGYTSIEEENAVIDELNARILVALGKEEFNVQDNTRGDVRESSSGGHIENPPRPGS